MRSIAPPLLLAIVLAASGCAAAVGDPAATPDYGVAPQPPLGSCHARGGGELTLPDRHCTPGAVDRRVTQADIHRTICRRGYPRRVRPPESVTEPEKRASMAAYGYRDAPRRYEYDHLISLGLGGAPNDPRNLWPQTGASPNRKDALEQRLHSEVCGGRIPLASAQRQIAGDWIAAYHRLTGMRRLVFDHLTIWDRPHS